jgi:hypothetical protein
VGAFLRFVRCEVGYGSQIKFRMIFGVGTSPKRLLFWNYLVLQECQEAGWQIMCSSLMKIFNGIYHLSYQCRVARWIWSLLSLIFSIYQVETRCWG